MEAGLVRLKEKRGVLLFQLPPPFRDRPRPARPLPGRGPEGQRVAVEFRHPTLGRRGDVRPSWNATTRPTASPAGRTCPASSGRRRTSSSSASTAPTASTCMPAPTPKTTSAGGPTGSRVNGQGRDVFAYFNNDGYGHAVRNAEALARSSECEGSRNARRFVPTSRLRRRMLPYTVNLPGRRPRRDLRGDSASSCPPTEEESGRCHASQCGS